MAISEKNGQVTHYFYFSILFQIRMASVMTDPGSEPFLVPETVFKDCVFRVTRGDYSPLLILVNENLKTAQVRVFDHHFLIDKRPPLTCICNRTSRPTRRRRT